MINTFGIITSKVYIPNNEIKGVINRVLLDELIDNPAITITLLREFSENILVNNKNKVLCIKNIDFNEKRIKVSCFDVIKFVIQNGAIKFIVVHNHTGNLIEPSLEDLNYTKTLQTEAKKFNLNLIDSIILNREDYFSFFEENLL